MDEELFLMSGVFGGGLTDFIFRDEFSDDRAAGAVDGTLTTDGKDTRAVTDTDSKLTISGGALNYAPHSTPSFTDPLLQYGAIARTAGKALFIESLTNSGSYVYVGFANVGVNVTFAGFRFMGANIDIRANGVGLLDVIFPYQAGMTLVSIFKTAGVFFLSKNSGVWKLEWVDADETGTNLYPTLSSYGGTGTYGFMRLAQLPAPFNVDDVAPVDEIAGAVAAGTAFTHEADCTIEFEVTTLPSAGGIAFAFRVEDDENKWYLSIDSAGNIVLYEEVNDGLTARGSSLAAVANGNRIVVIAEDEVIRVYVDNALEITYSSAANFKTETSGKLTSLGTGGAVSDLVTYGRGAGAFATDRLMGICVAGDTFVHEADCLIGFELTTLPTADFVKFQFRKQDATNYWALVIFSSGTAVLKEYVGGSATDRGSIGGAVGGERFVIICDNETIKVYVDNALGITYTSAANFKTETDGELDVLGTGGAVSDIITWPRTLSGTARNILNKHTR